MEYSNDKDTYNLENCMMCFGKYVHVFHNPLINTWYVMCLECGTRTYDYFTIGEAIDAWNKWIYKEV